MGSRVPIQYSSPTTTVRVKIYYNSIHTTVKRCEYNKVRGPGTTYRGYSTSLPGTDDLPVWGCSGAPRTCRCTCSPRTLHGHPHRLPRCRCSVGEARHLGTRTCQLRHHRASDSQDGQTRRTAKRPTCRRRPQTSSRTRAVRSCLQSARQTSSLSLQRCTTCRRGAEMVGSGL